MFIKKMIILATVNNTVISVKKHPLVLAKYNLKWVTEVDVFSFVNYLNGGAELI